MNEYSDEQQSRFPKKALIIAGVVVGVTAIGVSAGVVIWRLAQPPAEPVISADDVNVGQTAGVPAENPVKPPLTQEELVKLHPLDPREVKAELPKMPAVQAGLNRPMTVEERRIYGFLDSQDVRIVTSSPKDGSPPAVSFIVPTKPLTTAPDQDNDGLSDAEEKTAGTDVNKADTDGDGVTDYDEVKVEHTDPLKPDTDGDGKTDAEEHDGFPLDPTK